MLTKKQIYKSVTLLLITLMLSLFVGTSTFAKENDDPGIGRLGGANTKQDTDSIQLFSTPFYPIDFTHNPIYDDCILLNGIDVSKYQKEIDWELAKAAGVDFAFIRVGYRGYGDSGNFGADTYYDQNMQGAIAAGIPVGVYFFSQAITEEEAIEEANYILDRIPYYTISMPLVMDFEYASASGGQTGRLYNAKLSKQEATNICLAFCETIEASGYEAMVYANRNMLEKGLYPEQIEENYDIWLANYTNETGYTGPYSFWQYTSKGNIDGIEGNVDCNFWYKKTPDKVTGLNILDKSDYTISLEWQPSVGSHGYQIYRSTSLTGDYKRVASVSGEAITAYIDTSVDPATTYYYKVRAYLKFNGNNYFGSCSSKEKTFTLPSRVENLTITPSSTSSLTLRWDKTEKSNGYRIYRYDEENEIYKKITTIQDGEQTYFTNHNLDSANNYQYKISAFSRIDGSARFGYSSEMVVSTPLPEKITSLIVGGKTSSRLRLNWSTVDGVDGYQIYFYDKSQGKYIKLKTVSSDTLTYVSKNLEPNTSYKFKVRAYKRINGKNYFASFAYLKIKTSK